MGERNQDGFACISICIVTEIMESTSVRGDVILFMYSEIVGCNEKWVEEMRDE